MTEKTLVDSNVLVYAYDLTSERHGPAKKALGRLMLENTGVVSIQNLVEFSRVVTEKLSKAIPPDQVRYIVTELSESLDVITYDARTVADALRLCESYGLHFFDALLVSTMEKESIRVIVTEDAKGFARIPWLTVVNPFK